MKKTNMPPGVSVELGERRADRVMGKQSAEERHREDTLNTQAHTHTQSTVDRHWSYTVFPPFFAAQSIHSHAKSANESEINYSKVNYSVLQRCC